jgi:hypothetical protein
MLKGFSTVSAQLSRADLKRISKSSWSGAALITRCASMPFFLARSPTRYHCPSTLIFMPVSREAAVFSVFPKAASNTLGKEKECVDITNLGFW